MLSDKNNLLFEQQFLITEIDADYVKWYSETKTEPWAKLLSWKKE